MQTKQFFKYILLFTPILSLMLPTFIFVNGGLSKCLLLFVSPLVFITSIAVGNVRKGKIIQSLFKYKYLILFCLLHIIVEFYHNRNITGIKVPILYAFTVVFPLLSCEFILKTFDDKQSYFCFICDCITLIGLITIGYAIILNLFFVMNNLDYEIFYVDDFLMRYQVIEILNIKFKQRVILTEMARYASFFKNPNTFGHLLAFSSMWTIHKCFINSNKSKTIYISKLLALIYGVYLSGSKNSMLFLIVFYILYLIINLLKNYKFNQYQLRLSAIIVVFISFFMSLLLLYRGYGTTGRFDLWVYSIKLIKNRLSIGYGSRTFNEILWNATENHGAHNSYIHILGVGGLILGIPILILFKKIISKFLNPIYTSKSNLFEFIFSFLVASIIYQISENHALVLVWPCLIYPKTYYLLLNATKST